MEAGEHKHKRARDKGDREHKKKRHRSDKEASSGSSKRKDRHGHKATRIVDDDVDDEDMWTEMNIDMDGEKVRASNYVCDHG